MGYLPKALVAGESSDIRRQNADRAVHDIVYKWLSGTGLLYRGVR